MPCVDACISHIDLVFVNFHPFHALFRPPGVFGVSIGGGSNPCMNMCAIYISIHHITNMHCQCCYLFSDFLHYLSSVSRGKSVHLVDPQTAHSELDGLLSEMESPFCRDLTVKIAFKNRQSKFEAHEMVHPHPVPDLYRDHAVLLKVTVPKDTSYQMQAIEVKGTVKYEDGLRLIEIPVTNNQDDMELNESFAMDLALAESHLNHLHSNMWLMDDFMRQYTDQDVEKWRKLANDISDETGISSPTRSLQSSQEALSPMHNAQSEAGLQDLLLKRNESLLALPQRTGRGHRRKKEVSNKKKGAAVAVAATMGSVAVVAVFNPFGGDDSIFGAIIGTGGGDCCGGDGCEGCEECPCCDDCDECCIIL